MHLKGSREFVGCCPQALMVFIVLLELWGLRRLVSAHRLNNTELLKFKMGVHEGQEAFQPSYDVLNPYCHTP